MGHDEAIVLYIFKCHVNLLFWNCTCQTCHLINCVYTNTLQRLILSRFYMRINLAQYFGQLPCFELIAICTLSCAFKNQAKYLAFEIYT